MTELALNQDVAEYLRLAVETTLRDTFNFSVKFEQWSLDKRALALDASVACAVAMTEDNCDRGTLILALSRPAVMKILQTYGIKDTENAAVVNDAVEEITNMVYGMVKTALNRRGCRFVMALPQVLPPTSGGRYADAEKMIMPFTADDHRCRAVIAVHA